jgi:hypothetical protein
LTAVEQSQPSGNRVRDWANRYPPLLLLVLIAFIALAVLPSALNLPQNNPSQTLEYAPIPPKDQDNAPPAGNIASLGLAGGSTLAQAGNGGEGPGGAAAPGQGPAGAGRNPSLKHCVGQPLRQTEDPMSPPCVANFSGNNFGATYQGVNKDEIRILIYIEGNFTDCVTSQGCETRPSGVYVDLAQPPKSDDTWTIRTFRGWQRYFNDRYQTYNRFVHFILYYSNSNTGSISPEQRRGDAADNFATVHPFAMLNYGTTGGNADAYTQAMNDRGVLTFGSFVGRPASFYQQYPKLVWGYQPSIEVQAKIFSTYVCQKVVAPGKVTFAGDQSMIGKPRVLGLLRSADDSNPGFGQFAALVKSQVEACGGHFAAEETFPQAGFVQSSQYSPRYATAGVADFKQKGVTTIIWPQGYETNYSHQASAAQYNPEWIIAGDHNHEGVEAGGQQDQSEWDHAWVVTTVPYTKPVDQTVCYQAYRSADPDASPTDVSLVCTGTYYQDLERLFTGIQVAGPRLGPSSVDHGMHAIPAIPSKSNEIPACYYEPGDYTCVKDSVPMWWDSQCQLSASSRPGCWRMPEKGRRYLAGQWPSGDVIAQKQPNDLPNSFDGGIFINGGAPKG